MIPKHGRWKMHAHVRQTCRMCKGTLSSGQRMNVCSVCNLSGCIGCVNVTSEGVMVCLGTRCHMTAKMRHGVISLEGSNEGKG